MPQPTASSPPPFDVSREFANVRFGDKRLSARCLRLVDSLQRSPAQSLPAVTASGSELDAAYEFLNNDKVVPGSLLHPHVLATLGRAAAQPEWLVVHDTSEMDYDGERAGLGPLCDHRQGYLAHCSLAVSAAPSALPLGVVHLELLTRPPEPKRRVKQAQKRLLRRKKRYDLTSDNEHFRWERAVTETEKLVTRHRLTRPIHLMDREGDSFLLHSQMAERNRRFIIRLMHNRKVKVGQATHSLSQAFEGLPVLARRTIMIASRKPRNTAPQSLLKHPERTGRRADVVITSQRLLIERPSQAPDWLPPTLEANVVRVYEPSPPEGEKPIEWRLITSEPIATTEQVERVVDLYRRRWLIEEFFQALKSGCAVLERQFDDVHALQNVLAISTPMAWQMLTLRAVARADETAPATAVLSPVQVVLAIEASQRLPARQRLPRAPSAHQALRAIAGLGGHLTRNGEPGWKTLARGFEKLRAIESSLSLFAELQDARPDVLADILRRERRPRG